jgi:hypothetical protein
VSANLGPIQAKAASKRLALSWERGGGGWQHRLVDTKHGVLAFKSNRRCEVEAFIDARCIEVAAR